jgi:hypothetical protein
MLFDGPQARGGLDHEETCEIRKQRRHRRRSPVQGGLQPILDQEIDVIRVGILNPASRIVGS